MSKFDSEWLQARQAKQKATTEANRKSVKAKMSGKGKPKISESQMQKNCVRWFRSQYKGPLLLTFPNGGYHLAGNAKARAMQVNRMKAEGMMVGASDLVLIHNGGVAFMEAKTPKGKLSDNQKAFRDAVQALGYTYTVFRSLDGFIKQVKSILE